MANTELMASRVINCGCHSGTSFPTSSVVGQLFYRSDLKKLFVCTDAVLPVWTDDVFNSDLTGFETCFGNGGGVPYVEVLGEDLAPQASFVYPGSSKWTPGKIQVISELDPTFAEGDDLCVLQLIDFTNSTTICEVSFTSTEEISKAEFVPNFANLPTGEAIFQFQTRLDPVGGTTDAIRLHYVRLVQKPIVTGAGFGYVGGGSLISASQLSTVDKINFSEDTVTAITSTLTGTRVKGAGFASTTAGYFAGGANGVTNLSTVNKLTFSSDAIAAGVSSLTTTRGNPIGGFESSSTGYACGGSATTDISTINKLTFSNDNVTANTSNLTATKSNGVAGFSSTTLGYACGGSNGGAAALAVIDALTFSSESVATHASSLSASRINSGGFESTIAGYACGGVNAGTTRVSTINKLLFMTGAVSTLSSGITGTRGGAVGCANRKNGYMAGGRDNTVNLTTIDKVFFSNDSVSASSYGLSFSISGAVGAFETIQ